MSEISKCSFVTLSTTVFVINTVALGYLYNQQRNKSAVDSIKTDSLIPAIPVTQTESQAPAAPMAAPVPTTSESK